MTLPPDPGNSAPSDRWRTISSILLLVFAALLAPIVFLAGFAWPIFEVLHCRSSCDASWTGPIVIWGIGTALVGWLAFVGVRGIVRPRPAHPPRQDV
jgi:hypothetical protein